MAFITGLYRLSNRTQSAVLLCRYGVYGCLCALLLLDAGGLDRAGAHQPLLLLGAALLWHGYMRLYRRAYARWAYCLHLLEWLALCAWLLHNGVADVVYGTACFIFLAGNIALWGWTQALTMVALAVVPVTGWLGGNLQPVRDGPLVLAALAAAGLFALLICGLANQQSRQLGARGEWHRSRQRALLRYLPADVPDHLARAGEGSIERVWMVVAFVDLAGFTEACQRSALEELRLVINQFLAEATARVETWDGHVVKFLGDGLLCAFPAASTGGNADAALRAVRCFSGLPELMQRLNRCWAEFGYCWEHSATCGIACGFCAVGDWGGDGRRDFTIVGTPVNLAARLQSHAGGFGGMLLDQRTAGLVQGRGMEGVGHSLQVKGFGQVQAWAPQRNSVFWSGAG